MEDMSTLDQVVGVCKGGLGETRKKVDVAALTATSARVAVVVKFSAMLY